MKISYVRLAELAAATLVSSAVLLVAVTPAVIGAPLRLGQLDYSHVAVRADAPASAPSATLAT